VAAKRKKKEKTPREIVASILDRTADRKFSRVVWFPVKHYSPACAYHVGKLIRELKPAAVLVEGPDDATEAVQHIVDVDTRPPLTILSTHVDKKNEFQLNGVLSPSSDIPARFRGWWPLVEYAPEYQALVAGAEVGAELVFCDAPLKATIPYHHVRRRSEQQVVNDRHLAENAYFEALGQRQRRRSFEEFWQANFEVGGFGADTRRFMEAVLLFAWCARNVTGDEEANAVALEADGTLLREAHMKWHVREALKRHPVEELPDPPEAPEASGVEGEGEEPTEILEVDPKLIVVVTGAFHSVALPFKTCKPKRAKAKADRNSETLLTPHSFRALANLYSMNSLPMYGQRLWEAVEEDVDDPFNATAMALSLEIMREARRYDVGVSTADAIGCYKVARNLAVLRGNHEVTLDDLVDATQMAYVKGDIGRQGPPIEKALRETLIGHRLGRVTSAAGQAPLFRDFYDQCRTHKLDISGVKKVVRCDVHKQEKHRLKSAFLHRADFLDIPLFGRLDDGGSSWRRRTSAARVTNHYKGPDLVSGENMHLITETWGVQWREIVDDKLLELADRGASIAAAAGQVLGEEVTQAKGSAADTTKLLLRCAQMMLVDAFDDVLTAVEDAIDADHHFISLVEALGDFVVLHSYRDAVATQGVERLLGTITSVFGKACLVIPQLANSDDDHIQDRLQRLQTLTRIALTFEATPLDRQLLVEKIREMVADLDGAPAIRGAGYGILYAFGSTREKVVANELDGYALGTAERVLEAGAFLDGLLSTSKNIFMGSPRLLRAINNVLSQLDWQTFKLLLPDLRRAFTQFIPSEIDDISERVSEEIGIDEAPDPNQPIPEGVVRVSAVADERVRKLLDGWI